MAEQRLFSYNQIGGRMAFRNDYDFDLLENEAKRQVIEELGVQLGNEPDDICRCSECVLDMAAIALNAVKPLYRVSLMGALYASSTMNDEKYAASIKLAVADAISKVVTNPAHD